MIALYALDRIKSVNATLQIVRNNGDKGMRCGFKTYDALREWDEIIIDNEYGARLFGGIVERPQIDRTNREMAYDIVSDGYRKLFDRLNVADNYEGWTAQEIIEDLVAEYCPGFVVGEHVNAEIMVGDVLFNYAKPSEAITKILKAIGYTWYIDQYKELHVFAKNVRPAPQDITEHSNFHKNLKIIPDASGMVNEVLIRGGSYRSTVQSYKEVADGEKTQFVLPEAPHDIEVFIHHWNGATYDAPVAKTVGIKFGQQTATAEFQVNFAEKYIENGTHAVIPEGDLLEVQYTYDVPLRVKMRNETSIAAMQLLFPETNGVFQRVVNDSSLNSRDLAYQYATEILATYSNAMVSGSFDTHDDIFSPGELLGIDVSQFVGSSVIQSVTAKHVGGTGWTYGVKFATVLFGFEDFLRGLLDATKVDLKDGEVVETLYSFVDGAIVDEEITISTDLNQQTEGLEMGDEMYNDLNVTIEYVLGPYYPTSFADPKRVFVLDSSPLS